LRHLATLFAGILLGAAAWGLGHAFSGAFEPFDSAVGFLTTEPSDAKGQSRWLGGGQGMHFDLCQAAQTVLMEEATPPWLSIRG
jgi:hypothetical protein